MLVLERVRSSPPGFGFDVLTEQFGNMEEKGIIDPLKVTRTALQNASSIAGLALITEALVTDMPERKEAMPPAPEH